MTKKYDIETIKNYVEGNDIREYSIEELEDDPIFMKNVITYTNDKNIYNLCSEKVKTNGSFIKYIIKKFQDDVGFVCDVAEEYLKNSQEKINKMEVMLQVRNLIKNQTEYSDLYLEYSILLHAFYSEKRIEIEACKQTETIKETPALLEEIGLGFSIMQDEFSNSDAIIKFFAESLLTDIFFNEKEEDLEYILHKKFRSIEMLKEFGINKFLINFIREYDSNLSFYTSEHLEILNGIKDQLRNIGNRWEQYNKENEEKRYDILYKSVDAYIHKNDKEIIYTPLDIIYYFGIELGVEESIKEYDGNDWLDDELYNRLLSSTIINKDTMTIKELKHYYNIRRLMVKILSQDKIDESIDYYEVPKRKIMKTKHKV